MISLTHKPAKCCSVMKKLPARKRQWRKIWVLTPVAPETGYENTRRCEKVHLFVFRSLGSSKQTSEVFVVLTLDILESSIRLLGEAQSLVDHINDLGRIPAADSRGYKHATSSACYVVESLLEVGTSWFYL